MTRMNFGLGGTSPNSPAAGRQMQQEWRQPQGLQRDPGVDWSSPEYATPRPHAAWHSGKYMEPEVDVPQLPIRNIRVRAVPPAMYYTQDGLPIPSDTFLTVPISPGLIAAIRSGDLERGEDPDDEKMTPAPLRTPQAHVRRARPPQPQQSASTEPAYRPPTAPAAE